MPIGAADGLARRALVSLGAALVLSGTMTSLRLPILPLHLREELGWDPTEIGLFTALLTTLTIAVTLSVAWIPTSARVRKAIALGGSVAIALGTYLVARASTREAIYADALTLLPLSGAVATLLLIHARSWVAGAARAEMWNGGIRACLSLGFVLGPLVGSLVVEASGARGALLVGAALGAPLALLVWVGFRGGTQAHHRASEPHREPIRASAVVAFAIGVTVVLLGDHYRMSFLAIYTRELHGATRETAIRIFALAPIANLALMPFAGHLAERWGSSRVLALGCIFGAASMVLVATAPTIGWVYAAQPLHAVFVSAVYSLGMTRGQAVFGGRATPGIALFNACVGLSAVMANALGPHVASYAGPRWPFLIAAGACLTGLPLLVGGSVTTSTRVAVRVEP